METVKSPEQLRVEQIKNQLQEYGEENKLQGLEGRIQRGLDPAGMLAVEETRTKVEKVAEALGASMEDVIKLTNELHTGAIWDKADILAEGKDPAVKTWMSTAEVTVSGKEEEGDISEQEFIQDLTRVNNLLDEAINDPEEFAGKAKGKLIDRSKEQFTMDEDVPVSEVDAGFLAMAVNGHKSGIVEQGGLMFVGSKELDFSVLESMGLKEEEKEDRGRMATFYVNGEGEDVVKKLYGGFAIVLNGDKEVAKGLARTGERKE